MKKILTGALLRLLLIFLPHAKKKKTRILLMLILKMVLQYTGYLPHSLFQLVA